MKKVSELEGAELDYWVAKALGGNTRIQFRVCYIEKVCGGWIKYSPSTDWSQGGPIIESADISLDTLLTGKNRKCASISGKFYGGPTCLIAAMRAYVTAKFGETVDDSQAHIVQS